MAALCGHNQGEPHGVTVFFCPRKDPSSCFKDYKSRMPTAPATVNPAVPVPGQGAVPGMLNQQYQRPVTPQGSGQSPRTYTPYPTPTSATPTAEELTAIWKDVSIEMYAEYERGKWDGLVATWDDNGQKEFWCYYKYHKRNGPCCLFQGDRPRAVLECDMGEIKAVHLISGNQEQKTFASLEEADKDDTAQALMEEIDRIETRLKSTDRDLQKKVKRHFQMWIGKLAKVKRAEMNKRMAQRAAENQSALNAIKSKTALGR